MNEQKFTHQEAYDGIKTYEQFYEDNKRINYEEVCDKLNTLFTENKELNGLDVHPDVARRMICIFSDFEGVVEDLHPLFKRLLSCFNQLERESREGKGQKYKNNLIMLEYYVKEFEEACK